MPTSSPWLPEGRHSYSALLKHWPSTLDMQSNSQRPGSASPSPSQVVETLGCFFYIRWGYFSSSGKPLPKHPKSWTSFHLWYTLSSMQYCPSCLGNSFHWYRPTTSSDNFNCTAANRVPSTTDEAIRARLPAGDQTPHHHSCSLRPLPAPTGADQVPWEPDPAVPAGSVPRPGQEGLGSRAS